MYDITRRETFDNLSEVWLREVEMYATVPDCVKLVVANKARTDRASAAAHTQSLSRPAHPPAVAQVDREEARVVTRAEGVGFARAHGCLFLEVSAKSRQGVQEAFAELVQRVRCPGRREEGGGGGVCVCARAHAMRR